MEFSESVPAHGCGENAATPFKGAGEPEVETIVKTDTLVERETPSSDAVENIDVVGSCDNEEVIHDSSAFGDGKPVTTKAVEVNGADATPITTPLLSGVSQSSAVEAPSSPPRLPFAFDPFPFGDVLHPVALDLVYWRRPSKSFLVFSSLLILLISFSLFSAVSVVAHLSLSWLILVSVYVFAKRLIDAAQKKADAEHPLQRYLDDDVVSGVLPTPEKAHALADRATDNLATAAKLLRHYFLVVSVVDSAKLGLALYALTKVGAVFNLLTVAILAIVYCFAVPRFFEANRKEIEAVMVAVLNRVKDQGPVIKEFWVKKIRPHLQKAIDRLPMKEKMQ